MTKLFLAIVTLSCAAVTSIAQTDKLKVEAAIRNYVQAFTLLTHLKFSKAGRQITVYLRARNHNYLPIQDASKLFREYLGPRGISCVHIAK